MLDRLCYRLLGSSDRVVMILIRGSSPTGVSAPPLTSSYWFLTHTFHIGFQLMQRAMLMFSLTMCLRFIPRVPSILSFWRVVRSHCSCLVMPPCLVLWSSTDHSSSYGLRSFGESYHPSTTRETTIMPSMPSRHRFIDVPSISLMIHYACEFGNFKLLSKLYCGATTSTPTSTPITMPSTRSIMPSRHRFIVMPSLLIVSACKFDDLTLPHRFILRCTISSDIWFNSLFETWSTSKFIILLLPWFISIAIMIASDQQHHQRHHTCCCYYYCNYTIHDDSHHSLAPIFQLAKGSLLFGLPPHFFWDLRSTTPTSEHIQIWSSARLSADC